jgi:hypothetical protein
MRWEDQELNHATENKFPEVAAAFGSLLGHASRRTAQYLRVDQNKLDVMLKEGTLDGRAAGVRIHPLCLYFRMWCRLGPGGGHPALGVLHSWGRNSTSHYAILYVSPKNDWFDIMIIAAPAPNQAMQPTASPRTASLSDD